MSYKKRDNLHFRIFDQCALVKGASRSTVCDLQRKSIKFIPNDLVDILTEHKSISIGDIKSKFDPNDGQVIDSYFDFMLENEFIFLCEKEELKLFPKISLTYDQTSIITNAIIDINAASDFDVKSVTYQLSKLGCSQLLIRYFYDVSIDKIKSDLFYLKKSRIEELSLAIPYQKKLTHSSIEHIVIEFPRINSIIIYCTPSGKFKSLRDKNEILGVELTIIDQNISTTGHCGFIGPDYFVANPGFYLESLSYNNCLNRKISIDINGEIKNCPSMEKSFGNVKSTSLSSVADKSSFQKLWHLNKDSIDKCKDCEFRYVCSDCRAFTEDGKINSKPLHCNYNPYTAKWEN